MFLKISQYSQESTCVGVFLIKLKAYLYYIGKKIKNFFFPYTYRIKYSKQLTTNFNKSSRPEVFCRKGVLSNFAKFTGKYLCQGLLFNKVAGLRPATLLKKRLWHKCFPVNFTKFLRTPFLQNTSGGCFCSTFGFQSNAYKESFLVISHIIFIFKFYVYWWKENEYLLAFNDIL